MSTNQEPEQPQIIIPWWQDGSTISEEPKEPYFLSKGISKFFTLLKNYLLLPLQQADALTCSEALLNIMAWDRDITRFNSEPLSLYRKRVKYALVNAKDSGSVAGFIAIFNRLGVGFVEVNERLPGRDWDVISIKVDDAQLSASNELLIEIIRQYGRTCRRYEFEVVNQVNLLRIASSIDWQQECNIAVLED
jgi:hypothetical protein